jgi:AraC-like DNA-binding protein
MKELAVQGDFSISDVATEAGFASFPSFYRAFTKYERTSPSSWLKNVKG